MTPSGIELGTFRFVAQRLNHCATAIYVSRLVMKRNNFSFLSEPHTKNTQLYSLCVKFGHFEFFLQQVVQVFRVPLCVVKFKLFTFANTCTDRVA